jgi:hypothetical protein
MKVKFFILSGVLVILAIGVGAFLTIRRKGKGKPTVVVRQITLKREQREDIDMQNKESQPEYVEGEILVKFKDGVSQEEIQKFLSEYNLKVMEVIKSIGVYKLSLPEGKGVKEVLKEIEGDPRIKYAEPNYLFRLY